MADKRGIQMVDKKHTKTERQLLLYEIIFTSRIIEIEDIVKRLSVNKKTVFRDIRDLTDAGLVSLIYSRKEKAYLRKDATNNINEPEGTLRYKNLKKLVRLTRFMEELSEAADNSDFNYNCRKRYEELFPDVSERTRMRDYKTMKNIGYDIHWDKYMQSHSVTGYLYQIRENFD